MLITVALIGLLAYLASSLVLGARLLLASRKTRELADWAMGLAYFFGGGLGWAAYLVSQTPSLKATAFGAMLERSSLFFLVLGVSAMTLAIWRLFRPDQRWAALLVGLLTISMGVEVIHNCILTATAFPKANDVWYWPGAMARNVAFIWLPYEAFRYHGMLRRRLPLGLTTPRVVNQMFLWGFAGATTLVVQAVAVTASVLGVEHRYGVALALVFAVSGMLGGGAIWLAFFPPAFYVRFVERGADEAQHG